MPEGNANIELAEHLRQHGQGTPEELTRRSRRRIEALEIVEAIVLAIVALATALSGYQAATWDGHSAQDYATSGHLRLQSEQVLLEGTQRLAYNAGNVNSWLQAKTAGDERLAAILAERFTPDYKPAFDAWVKTDPLHNRNAPAGPAEMPQFRDSSTERSEAISEKADVKYDEAVEARHTGEKYVRLTVILAAVLFLIAISQRFVIRGVRWAVLTVAGGFLIYCVVLLIMYPRV
jgi:hypothetical protein